MKSNATIRLFVSSTFSDLKAEEPFDRAQGRLKQLCLAKGLRFQAIDLRWGMSSDQDTFHSRHKMLRKAELELVRI